MEFASRHLPLNAKYKAVMAIADSNPLRVLGVSNTFDVLPNTATLTTDEAQYYEGELIDIIYTMSENVDHMERYYGWVALFAHDVSDYSLPAAALQSTGYWHTGSTGTMEFASRHVRVTTMHWKELK
jgi:hypothetical protein